MQVLTSNDSGLGATSTIKTTLANAGISCAMVWNNEHGMIVWQSQEYVVKLSVGSLDAGLPVFIEVYWQKKPKS